MACIEARGLRKAFGTTIALDGINLRVEEGRILGPHRSERRRQDHRAQRDSRPHSLRRRTARCSGAIPGPSATNSCAMSASLPTSRCCRAGCGFRRRSITSPACIRASIARRRKGSWRRRTIKRTSKVRQLSKGMVAQLHLALVMAIDARLLVLDEPTLGLDILYRKQFYDSLLNDYFDRSRTIVVTTHQVEEIQNVLTDLMFINHGRIVLECSMEEFESRYAEVMVHPDHLAAAQALRPMHERQVFGRSILLFDNVDRQQLAALGDVRTPGIADLFVAVMGDKAGDNRRSGSNEY